MTDDLIDQSEECPTYRGYNAVVEWRLNHIEADIKVLKEAVSELSDYSYRIRGSVETIKWLVGAGLVAGIAALMKYLMA